MRYRRALKSGNTNIEISRATRHYYRQKFSWKRFFFIIILIILIVSAGGYFFFFSNFFRIKDIKIIKTTNHNLISSEQIKGMIYPLLSKKVLFVFPYSNLFLFNKKQLEKNLLLDSRIKSLQINKILPKTLEITVEEASFKAILIILGDSNRYVINSRGQIIKNLAEENELNNLPIFYDASTVNVYNQHYIDTLKEILEFLNNNLIAKNKIKIDFLKITNHGNTFEIKMNTQEGWKILLDSKANFNEEIKNLSLILDNNKESRGELNYIDLRFGDKIFYKLKGE